MTTICFTVEIKYLTKHNTLFPGVLLYFPPYNGNILSHLEVVFPYMRYIKPNKQYLYTTIRIVGQQTKIVKIKTLSLHSPATKIIIQLVEVIKLKKKSFKIHTELIQCTIQDIFDNRYSCSYPSVLFL